MKQPRSVIEITKALVLVAKFNPYHDKLGRFTSKGKANFVSTSMKAGTGKIVPYTPGMKKEFMEAGGKKRPAIDKDTLVKIGGKTWEKNGMSRVYFNDLPSLYGLEYKTYKTGNISSATLHGESISNSAANKILNKLSGKLWWDASDKQFHYKDLSEGVAGDLVKSIAERVAGL